MESRTKPVTETTETCEKHGNYIAQIVEIFGVKLTTRCPKCEEEEEWTEAKERELEVIRCHNAELQSRGIEPEFFNATFDNFIPENETERMALDVCKRLVNKDIKKVLLLGSNGCGKTHLGCAVAKMTGGRVITMFEISALIRKGYRDGLSEIEVLDELLKYPVLIIDEVGRTKGSDAERNWWSYLLDKAHVRGILLMLISNRHLARYLPKERQAEAFEYFFDNDVISRLKQDSVILEVNGRDRRSRDTTLPAV